MKNIKLLVLDVDGVLTNGKLHFFVDENNKKNVSKEFDVKDGFGLDLLKKSGIKLAIISGRKDESTILRLEELKPDFFILESKDKLISLNIIAKNLSVNFSDIAYIGDDLPDLECLKNVGLSLCPNDAVKEVLEHVDIILSKNGGEGCVREFCDMLLKEKFENSLEKIFKKINN